MSRPLQLSHSFYLLNPDGDLCETQQTFEEQLKQLCREVGLGAWIDMAYLHRLLLPLTSCYTWVQATSRCVLDLTQKVLLLSPSLHVALLFSATQGLLLYAFLQGYAGSPPAASQLVSALQQYDLFLYFGHGAAQQYLPLSTLRGLDRCAASLLMGCSSGKLRPAGVYEPHGPVWDYLMAGACGEQQPIKRSWQVLLTFVAKELPVLLYGKCILYILYATTPLWNWALTIRAMPNRPFLKPLHAFAKRRGSTDRIWLLPLQVHPPSLQTCGTSQTVTLTGLQRSCCSIGATKIPPAIWHVVVVQAMAHGRQQQVAAAVNRAALQGCQAPA